ncbi:MAG: hypothetical protein QOH97_1755 [Actinoplanes sp.]|jgi:hypothetical protein|nr:hypothetical protein [Actinoplanes sp.]
MERGPLALFGAIIAVGLGPAMWLGAQFGHVASATSPPPAAVVVQENTGKGGEGAAAPADPGQKITTDPKGNGKPLVPAARPKPRESRAAPSASASAKPRASASTLSDDQPPTPPTGSSSTPSDQPSSGGPGSGQGDGPQSVPTVPVQPVTGSLAAA